MKTPLLLYLAIITSLSLLGTTTTPTARKINIKLEHTLQLSNNGVGNEWTNYLSINKKVIKKDETLTLELIKRAPLRIEAHSIEEDDKYPDFGQNHMVFTYSDLIAVEESSRFEMDVEVMENGGENAGHLAKWKFIFELSKVE